MEQAASELINSGLGDYRLVSLQWSEDGSDLSVILAAPGGGKELCLRFVWTTGVRVEMDFGEYVGRPLVYESKVRPTEAGQGSQVTIGFGGAPDGAISFICGDARVVESEEP
jgi:hypothetical protein